jgi:Uma2 family endonuclease
MLAAFPEAAMSNLALKPMTHEAFLDWEATQERRFEFADGQPVAMAGGTQRHDSVRGAIYASLLRALGGRGPCRAFLDVKVVCPNGSVRYPDVAVDCGPRDPNATQLGAPSVVIEVLSPSTRSTDYLRKPRDYGSVESVEVYLIVDPDTVRIDVLRRTAEGLELVEEVDDVTASIALGSTGVALALADIYADATEG